MMVIKDLTGYIGRNQNGERNFNAKLTDADIRAIRFSAFSKEPVRSIARRFGLGEPNTYNIIRGRAWKHVK